jgi:hypothetical protein
MKTIDLARFHNYVLSFYGVDGIHSMGATPKLVKQATATHLKILKLKGQKFEGDSFDRERVGELLLDKYKLSFSRPEL